jgi:hypothetical protein
MTAGPRETSRGQAPGEASRATVSANGGRE